MSAQRHAVILGMGLMGCDIAAIFLAGGWRVSAVETNRVRWPDAEARVRSSIGQLDGNPDDAAHLTLVDAMEAPDYASAEIVVEAVPERLALKQEVFARLDTLVPEHIPVVSNASGYRITDIAGLATRARCANPHSSCRRISCPAWKSCRANTPTLRCATRSPPSWTGSAAR